MGIYVKDIVVRVRLGVGGYNDLTSGAILGNMSKMVGETMAYDNNWCKIKSFYLFT